MYLFRLGKDDFACALKGARKDERFIIQNREFGRCVLTFIRTTVSAYELQQNGTLLIEDRRRNVAMTFIFILFVFIVSY